MTQEDYKELTETIIQKQISIIGPLVAVKKAREAEGLVVDDQGKVLELNLDPVEILENLTQRYASLSGPIAVDFCKKAIEPLVAKYHPKLPVILQ